MMACETDITENISIAQLLLAKVWGTFSQKDTALYDYADKLFLKYT